MNRFECPYEQDTLDALTARRLPGRAGQDLLSHLAGCEVCRDLVLVAGAMQQACDEEPSAALPSAATVWWRAQLRAHRDASSRAAVPIRVAQGAAVVVALVTCAALQPLIPAWRPTLPVDPGALAAWWPGMPSIPFAWPSFGDLPSLRLASFREISGWWWLALAAGAWTILAPLALYLARVDE